MTKLANANSAIRELVMRHDIAKSDVELRIYAAVHRYGNQKTMAKAMGISEAHLSEMIRGTRGWSEDLLAHVGVEKYTAYHDCGKPPWLR
jgi:hypothetical protein